jgi:CRISPR system Cascade subunit CasE
MYLSQLHLNPRARLVRHDLGNPYELHSTIAKVLAPEKHYLWRLEDTVLLVQSQQRPDWGQLEPGYLARPSLSKPFEPQLRLAIPYRFRLRANPTICRVKDGGKRTGLYKTEEQLLWLERQAAQHGFEILDTMVSSSERRKFEKRAKKDDQDPSKNSPKMNITLAVVEFDGVLCVTDPVKALLALEKGIGHGKALGLGLLSLALAG